jgi:hypothetical protein
MPKLVKEITSGNENSRSVDGGQVADVSVRSWRVILNSPSEAYDVQQAIGVYIGDTHPVNTSLPCVSISEKVEGDSRVVRIVTANYRTTPGADPGNDPNKQPPDIRPAQYSISSSLIEVPATEWRRVGNTWVFPGLRNGPFGNGGFCWVAREVYGADDYRWLLFREWLINDSPRWLLALYAARGERFAAWISSRPLVKRAVRHLMNLAIRGVAKQKYGGSF